MSGASCQQISISDQGVEAVDSLRAVAWAHSLSGYGLELARKGVSERTYPKGSHIFRVGDSVERWIGVRKGLLKLCSLSRSGRSLTLSGICDGGWFGEGSILRNEPCRYDVVTLRETQIVSLKKGAFLWLYQNSMPFSHFLLRHTHERMDQLAGIVEQQRFLKAPARVARTLYWLLNPTLNPNAKSRIEITQLELGSLAGLSRANTNYGLRILKEAGYLTVEGNAILVNNLSAIARYE